MPGASTICARWLRAARTALVAAGLVLAPALPGSAQSQQEDVGFITGFLQDVLSEAGREVRILGFEGALSSRATIRELTIADDDGVWLVLRGAVLDWNRAALLRRQVEINELAADEIILLRLPEGTGNGLDLPAPEARDFTLPELPVSLRIGRLRIEKLRLEAPVLGETAELTVDGFARLADGAGETRLEARRTDGPRGLFRVQGSFDNASRVLDIDLALEEEADGIAARLLDLPGRPEAEFEVSGTGPLSDFSAQILLATDGVTRLVGQVELTAEAAAGPDGGAASVQRFRAALGGDIAPLLDDDLHPFFGDGVQFVAEGAALPDGRLEVEFIDLRAENISVTGSFLLGADRLPEVMQLRGLIATRDGSPAQLPVADGDATVDRVRLLLDFDAARGEDWSADITVDDLWTPGFAAARLALVGEGRIFRSEVGRGVEADFSFSAEGLEPADPGLAEALGQRLTGRANLSWTEGQPLALRSFGLAGRDFVLNGAGQVDGMRIAGRIEARADALERVSKLAGRPLGGVLRGVIEGEFALLTGAFDLSARFSGQDLSAGIDELDRLLAGSSQIVASVRRDTTGTEIRQLSADAQTLSANVSGRVASGEADVSAVLDFRNLSVMGMGYGGSLAGTARYSASDDRQQLTARAEGRDLSVGIAELDGLLRGLSEVDIDLTRSERVVQVETLRIAANRIALSAGGRIGPDDIAITADLGLQDLSALGPRYGGAIRGSATLTETGGVRRLRAELTGQDLAAGIAELDRLLAGTSRVDMDVRSDGGAGFDIDRFALMASGLSAAATGRVEPGASALDVEMEFGDLGVLGARYGGNLRATGTLREEGSLRSATLEATAQGLAVGIPQVNALLRGSTELRLAASEQDGRIRIGGFRLSNPQMLAEANDAGADRLQIRARVNDLSLVAPGVVGTLAIIGELEETEAGYRLDLTGRGPVGTEARVIGTVDADLARVDLAVTGSGDLALANPSLDTITIQGPVGFDLRVQGRPVLSSVSGRASTSGARIVSPRQLITVDDVAGTATLSGGRAALEGSARLGGGQVSARGSMGLDLPFPVDLQVTVAGARITDRRIFETTVDGTLAVAGPLRTGGTISGNVRLSDTELRLPSTGLGGSGFIPPMRHVNEPSDVRRTRDHAGLTTGRGDGGPRIPWNLDLAVSSPNRIFLRGRGLDAELGGTLILRGTTAEVVPSGEFGLIRGRLDLLGRRFTLSDGFARLQGRFIPFVQLVAATTTRELSARIIVSGEADALELRFESVPELPDEEILARLLFGQELGRLSAFQAAQLASAVATLAGRGGDGIIGNLRQAFGFADFDITSDTQGQAALRVGRYLAENIYTDITVDSQGRSEVSINLDVSPSVTVRGRTDSEGRSGVGIFFERDY